MRLCVLVTRPPPGEDGDARVFGALDHCAHSGSQGALYLIGDGVLLAKAGPYAGRVRGILDKGIAVRAGAGDLAARGITDVEGGVEILDDLEGAFVDDALGDDRKVITW